MVENRRQYGGNGTASKMPIGGKITAEKITLGRGGSPPCNPPRKKRLLYPTYAPPKITPKVRHAREHEHSTGA
jgi:hypothetical protein